MRPAVGALVTVRGREWVVLPAGGSDPDTLLLRPLAGTDDEVTGVYLPLEPVEPARFAPPDAAAGLGNHRSCGLLREAIRLGFRSSAGPFRCVGRIAVEPRPYQLVPLLMALRLDPVRLLIADSVGTGKTVEACLIARELIDRGEVERVAILCPPHLGDHWRRALSEQFHIEAELVMPSTASRLERQAGLSPHDSLFEHYPHVIVSLDYIKSDARRHEFVRTCPELVIVDEAHTCTPAGMGRGAQQRHALIRALAQDPKRHLILVTATPHSGKEENFRALLALLDPSFAELPTHLAGEAHRGMRERLAQHLVQRRRGDVEAYLDIATPFPEREQAKADPTYTLSEPYRSFFGRVLAYCRESVQREGEETRRNRVRWWSALALLRSLSSSPRAAAATLRTRAANADTTSVDEADDVGRRAVLDQDEDTAEPMDVAPGGQPDTDESAAPERRRLLALARDVEQLTGPSDHKLAGAIDLVNRLLADGFNPILFCRFIPTVDYVATALRESLGSRATVGAVTGDLAPEDRERRVNEIVAEARRVLVCTDCLSEGINLQHGFDAVVHYDLSWNPTRHEQREGRVDRYGQPSARVRALTYYGEDNPVDRIVLDVLLRKHKAIRAQLGISVPVPLETNALVEAVFDGLLAGDPGEDLQQLSFAFAEPARQEVDVQWQAAAERETQSRAIFAQRAIKVEEVAQELCDTQRAVGDSRALAGFVREVVPLLGGSVGAPRRSGPLTLDLSHAPLALRETLPTDGRGRLDVVFEEPAPEGALLLSRTHPLVAALADVVWTGALDAHAESPARRSAVVRTTAVARRTTVLLLRLRFHIVTEQADGAPRPLLAEEVAVVGFEGAPEGPRWIDSEAAEKLLDAQPEGNVAPEIARDRVAAVVAALPSLAVRLDELAHERGEALLEAHRRVRRTARQRVRALRVEPHCPPDTLGLFVYLPVVRSPVGGHR